MDDFSVGMIPLPSGAVHVWRIGTRLLPGDLEECQGLLSDEERDRAARYLHARDRDRFLFTHAALRRILGAYTGRPARELQFSRGADRKPYLAIDSGDPPPMYNLSHTEELSLLAVTPDGPIGVDVERLRPLPDAERIAKQFFSGNEAAALHAVPPEDRLSAFFRGWTRKEAYLKAVGEGLLFPLDAFDVSVGESAGPVEVAFGTESRGQWFLHDLELGPPFVGAVALQVKDVALSIREWIG